MSYEIVRFGHLQNQIYECDNRADLFVDQNFMLTLAEVLEKHLADDNTVLSLDVFDTLIFRDNSSELERFLDIGHAMWNLYSRDMPANFSPLDAFFARDLGTKASYRASNRVMGAREGSLLEIHQTACRLLQITDIWAEQFVRREIGYEATRIVPNTFFIDYIEKFVSKGRKVVLLSDMYFHANHIATLLSDLHVDLKLFHKIYSSGDEKISKASGLIFNKVAMDLNHQNFFHVGDSFRSDYLNPMRAGWAALHLPLSRKDMEARRQSHDDKERMLKEKYQVSSDIQRP